MRIQIVKTTVALQTLEFGDVFRFPGDSDESNLFQMLEVGSAIEGQPKPSSLWGSSIRTGRVQNYDRGKLVIRVDGRYVVTPGDYET